ncbi:MAG TPA: hypothetical protein GX008_09400 [Firmicutes bacterium]|jgi:hypothetical protein|nr:MAG: hypothetical protein AA931_07015 [Peptococcaceae bacterium 1109]HHT73914.1 hypothetical protein [Bacillota bacterium]
MIVYCGIRHFYIQHFQGQDGSPQQDEPLYILTHAGQTWDFSPELKQLGFSTKTPLNTIHHLGRPVQVQAIDLEDFYPYTEEWLEFPRQYSSEIEVEYPHAWYVRLPSEKMAQYFCADFAHYLAQREASAIWGGGESKIVAKFAAHNLALHQSGQIVPPGKTEEFLAKIPIGRLPLPEADILGKLGITSLGELGKFPLQDLMGHFGSRAEVLLEIARGKDPVPFQPQHRLEFSWNKDFTTTPDLYQAIAGPLFQPYLAEAGRFLAQKLQSAGKVGGKLVLSWGEEGCPEVTAQRKLKTPTADAKTLVRNMAHLLPRTPITHLKVTVQDLEPAPADQLELFQAAEKKRELPQTLLQKLPAQKGLTVSRRELVLEMWRELVL